MLQISELVGLVYSIGNCTSYFSIKVHWCIRYTNLSNLALRKCTLVFSCVKKNCLFSVGSTNYLSSINYSHNKIWWSMVGVKWVLWLWISHASGTLEMWDNGVLHQMVAFTNPPASSFTSILSPSFFFLSTSLPLYISLSWVSAYS